MLGDHYSCVHNGIPGVFTEVAFAKVIVLLIITSTSLTMHYVGVIDEGDLEE
jgi:hypothetical protein